MEILQVRIFSVIWTIPKTRDYLAEVRYSSLEAVESAIVEPARGVESWLGRGGKLTSWIPSRRI